MMTQSPAELRNAVESGALDPVFVNLYGKRAVIAQRLRYLDLLKQLSKSMADEKVMFVSAPGRTELGGNHTDHNHGCIIAAAVDLDCVAAVTPINSPEIVLSSEAYPAPIRVDLRDLKPRQEEEGTAQALVRGVAATLADKGLHYGFRGQLQATCIPGTGISSSAAFSVLVGAVCNFLYLGNSLTPQELAAIAQKAENDYFGKPCGLMDQMASAVGQTVFVDFCDPEQPTIEQIEHTLVGTGYRLAIIDTGGSHTELTPEYAAVPLEMVAAAHAAGGSYGRDVSLEQFVGKITAMRNQAGDRAVLRLLHFIEENKRVCSMAGHLRGGDFSAYLQAVRASGQSSCTLLQNCSTLTTTKEQGILLALALSKIFCPEAVCRVHGGGFAGTVQVYVPEKYFAQYTDYMEGVFGHGKVHPIRIGRPGVCGIGAEGMMLPSGI